MIHGIATANEAYPNIKVEKDEQGIVTAYLPEMEKFAVMFKNDNWITFTMKESEFLNMFQIEK